MPPAALGSKPRSRANPWEGRGPATELADGGEVFHYRFMAQLGVQKRLETNTGLSLYNRLCQRGFTHQKQAKTAAKNAR